MYQSSVIEKLLSKYLHYRNKKSMHYFQPDIVNIISVIRLDDTSSIYTMCLIE